MPTLDVDDGLAPGIAPTDEQVIAYFRRYLPDFYFVNTPLSRMRRHLQLLRTLPQQPVNMEFFRAPGANFTELVLCAHDNVQPGLLSKVAGVLAALKINVHTAWIHSLRDPYEDGNRQIILDTLILSEHSFGRARALTPKTQKAVVKALSAVLAGQTNVLSALVQKRTQGTIEIHDLSATDAGPWTLIKLRAHDHSGVLYRVTQSLASLELDVAHAQINTSEKAVDDVFFVSGSRGGPLSPAEIPEMLRDLRAALASEGLPPR